MFSFLSPSLDSSDSLPPPQSEDLKAAPLTGIRATPYNSCRERNAHAHKTKLGSEEIGSNAEIEIRWQEDSQDRKAKGGGQESRENEKAGSACQKSDRCQETTGCRRSTPRRRGSTGCRSRSAACRRRSAGNHRGLTGFGILSGACCHLLGNC